MFGLGERARSLPRAAAVAAILAADRRAVIGALRRGLAGAKIDLDHRVVTPGG